ncbi:hypothetical protein C4D60_Mb11t20230 [Musa balbisiana]|uniref:Uncharacterized protein n=1 Tax=Musa balbisiana TaxID=52838 RepID=A0A4S8J5Q2_MUSBA|nr:hypothetical protein C4D60_Mb11t20230 [Musa balbisiana]
MALPGPYSGVSTLAFVARASAVTFGLVYGSVKLSYLQVLMGAFKHDIFDLKMANVKAKRHKKAEAKGFFTSLRLSSLSRLSSTLSNIEAIFIMHYQLLALSKKGDLLDNFDFGVVTDIAITNPCLHRTYVALRAWKKALYYDPHNFIDNWVNLDVCGYHDIFYVAVPDDPSINIVVNVNLNEVDIVGYLPVELGLLIDVTLLHINFNRFCGIISQNISRLKLHRLDASSDRFVGSFLDVAFACHHLSTLAFGLMTSREHYLRRSSIRSSTPYS